MAKIKKIDSQILHHTSKHVSGQVHPRLQKHVRQIPKIDPRIARMKDDERMRRFKDKKSTKEKDEHKKDQKYEFPFDKGYLKWLEAEIGYRNMSEKAKKKTAEDSKYQKAYQNESGKRYDDGSSLGGGGSAVFSGFTSAYVDFIAKEMGSHWKTMVDAYQKDPNSMFGKMALNVLNNSKLQTQYKDKTGNDPKSSAKKDEKKSSYTKEYVDWVRKNLSPKSQEEEDKMLGDGKAQTAYKNVTGKNPTA